MGLLTLFAADRLGLGRGPQSPCEMYVHRSAVLFRTASNMHGTSATEATETEGHQSNVEHRADLGSGVCGKGFNRSLGVFPDTRSLVSDRASPVGTSR